jgi:fatty acid desaturase
VQVRLFILFHDMAHDSYFPSHTANVIVGTLMGALDYSSFSHWKHGHDHHHRHRCADGVAAPCLCPPLQRCGAARVARALCVCGRRRPSRLQ